MADGVTTNAWGALVEVRLNRAMQASMTVCRKSARGATIQAVVHMAVSAGAETPVGAKRRPIVANQFFRHLLRKAQYKKLRMAGRDMRDYYRYTAVKLRQPPRGSKSLYGNSKPKDDPKSIAFIRRVGLAKISWRWGLRMLNSHRGGSTSGVKYISGVVTAGTSHNGVIGAGGAVTTAMVNRLSYVTKLLKAGWEDRVATKAANVVEKLVLQQMNRDQAKAAESGWAA